jgi:hypothetical protein
LRSQKSRDLPSSVVTVKVSRQWVMDFTRLEASTVFSFGTCRMPCIGRIHLAIAQSDFLLAFLPQISKKQ